MCFGAKQNPTPTGGTVLPVATAPVADVPVAPLDAPAAPSKPAGVTTTPKTTSKDTGLSIPGA